MSGYRCTCSPLGRACPTPDECDLYAAPTPPPAPAPSPAAAGLSAEDVERVARAIASEAIAVTLVTDDEWDFYLRPDEQEDYRRLAAAALAEMRPTAAEVAVKRVEALIAFYDRHEDSVLNVDDLRAALGTGDREGGR